MLPSVDGDPLEHAGVGHLVDQRARHRDREPEVVGEILRRADAVRPRGALEQGDDRVARLGRRLLEHGRGTTSAGSQYAALERAARRIAPTPPV